MTRPMWKPPTARRMFLRHVAVNAPAVVAAVFVALFLLGLVTPP